MILPAPTVVNVKSVPHDVYIGLGSMWGNPYSQTMPRGAAIKAYEKRLRRFMEDAGWRVELKALAGKKLGCHCSPQPCHGDVIVRIFLELYGPQGTMVSGGSSALGKATSGVGPEDQFHRSLHRPSLRRADLSDQSVEVDMGSVRAGQSRPRGEFGGREEGSGERN